MWTRLDNLKREQPLFEECSTYSGGRAKLIYEKTVNPSLRAFWINHLKRVLLRLGFEIPYESEVELAYRHQPEIRFAYSVENGVSYGYER
jgi:hypothetical protein